MKYSLRVEALFASEPEAQGQGAAGGSPATGPGSPSSAPRPAQGSEKVPADPPGKTPAPDKTSGTPPDSAPRRTREPTRRPESSVTLQTFLVTGTGSNIEWILLSAERSFRLEGKDLPVLRLDSDGALALDPRERKLRQLGPGDEIAPGLRPGDLVGHALANLGEDPRGGLGMKRLRRSEPLVKGLVHDTLSLVIWLTPRLPEPGSSAYSDSRPPPQSLIHDLGTWRRDIKEAPKSKDSPGPDRRFVVEGICELASPLEKAPAGPRAAPRGPGNGGDPKAPGKESSKEALPPLQLSGEVTMAPGALIPSHARIRITGHIPGKPPAREVNAELKTLGEACNR